MIKPIAIKPTNEIAATLTNCIKRRSFCVDVTRLMSSGYRRPSEHRLLTHLSNQVSQYCSLHFALPEPHQLHTKIGVEAVLPVPEVLYDSAEFTL
jgi:hypothetical protein